MDEIQRLEKARERVVEAIAKNIDLYGVTHSIGRMYGTLYFHDAPMTLEELGNSLGMSKTSMSAGVRVLTELKMVEKVWMKGTRKDLYEAEMDWYQTFIAYFDIKWRKAIHSNKEQINKSLAELTEILESPLLDKDIRQTIAQDIHKLQEAQAYYDWLLSLIDCMASGEIFSYIPKPEKAGSTHPTGTP